MVSFPHVEMFLAGRVWIVESFRLYFEGTRILSKIVGWLPMLHLLMQNGDLRRFSEKPCFALDDSPTEGFSTYPNLIQCT